MFKLQTFSTHSEFRECFKRFVLECEFLEKILALRLISVSQRAQTNRFFSQIQPIAQTTVIECAV